MSGTEISVIRHRRSYSKAFKAQVVAECSAVSFNQRMDTRRSDAAGTLPDFYEHQLPFVDESPH